MLKTLLLLLQHFLCGRNSATGTFCLRQDSYLTAHHFLRPSNREVRAQSPSASSTRARCWSTDVILPMHAAGCPLEGYLRTHCAPDLESRCLMPCDSSPAHDPRPPSPCPRPRPCPGAPTPHVPHALGYTSTAAGLAALIALRMHTPPHGHRAR
ncbi:hypothetical protein B0H14DRAFT_2966078 [Mycena olivaceomarginata]|nr:hypothetical protein B0H14DRAFT_2966078 [Mycena olivaceomarginata]